MSNSHYDYTHPEKFYKGLVREHSEAGKELFRKTKSYAEGEELQKELCWSCGWKVYNQIHSSYCSRIRIFHTRANMGLWSIGSKWVIRDQPNDKRVANNYITQQFLRNQPDLHIPLIKEMRLLNDPEDQIQFTLMSRAPGVPLDTILHKLSPEELTDIKDQLAGIIKELRQFTAPRPQTVDGKPLYDTMVGYCVGRRAPTCAILRDTVDEWFEHIAETLRSGLSRIHRTDDPTIIEEKLQELKDNFPDPEPYVLTHADLNPTNIMVKNGKIEAIIDWEMSGYYPWWAERWLSINTECCDTIFVPLWEDLCPEMDHDTFCIQVARNVNLVKEAWDASYEMHDHDWDAWLRPGFCECQPYTGEIFDHHIGKEFKHRLRDIDLDGPEMTFAEYASRFWGKPKWSISSLFTEEGMKEILGAGESSRAHR